jgi:hypothetical protein
MPELEAGVDRQLIEKLFAQEQRTFEPDPSRRLSSRRSYCATEPYTSLGSQSASSGKIHSTPSIAS